MTRLERRLFAVVAVLVLALAATQVRQARPAKAAEPLATAIEREAAVPAVQHAQGVDVAARFVAHRWHVQPGLVKPYASLSLRNPYASDPNAAKNGAKLFVSYNCADCHGGEGSGFMAPSLNDGRWHFGGADDELFESIYEGRPDGMPAWGSLIGDDQIWLLVSYVKTLKAGTDVTTENFTGRTVERMGH